MPAHDTYHASVRNALIKDGWTITHDPYTITFGQRDVFVDLGAIVRYRTIIRELIKEYSQYQPARGDVQIEVVFDESQDRGLIAGRMIHVIDFRVGRNDD